MINLPVLTLIGVALAWAAPSLAFSPQDCAENYISDDLPPDARAETLPSYFVEPGQTGADLICTLIPNGAGGTLIQVSEAIAGNPNGAFIQYFPDRVQVFRTAGDAPGLALSACGPIPDTVPPEQNPGGFWCRIDLAVGLGVVLDAEYATDGNLAWLNFEISARTDGILLNSTLAPVLHVTAPENLRAGVILTGPDVTYLLDFASAANVFRMADPETIIALFRAQRETPQDMTIVIETGDPETGPFAQADIPAYIMEDIMAELALLEQLIRTDRGL